MGGGDVRAHCHRRHDRRAARALLRQCVAGRDCDADHLENEQRASEQYRVLGAYDLAYAFAEPLTFALGAQRTQSRRSPFGWTIRSSGRVNSAIDLRSELTRISITSDRRRCATAAQSWRNVNTTGRTRLTT